MSHPAALTTLPATLRLGAVHLTVADADRAVTFYEDALGLRVHGREARVVSLGAGASDLVVLHEEPGARPAGRHAGLFHVALLHPSREELARALARLSDAGARLQGAADHGVSEALYLADPDGNGLELYVDRPREDWPAGSGGSRVGMFTAPLDLHALLETVRRQEHRPRSSAGLVVGHVHLHVGDLARALAFYGDALGLERMTSLPSAEFLAAGGYHHHLAVNTWAGEGVGPAPPGTVGLRRWTVVLEDADQLDAVARRLAEAGVETQRSDGALHARDPWGIALSVVVP
ncbi:MAG: VOC family protein [Solirubrobacteraceae bacterium MAG38_C4-C5]|nr:VOC family protein [Candidatus Siliceabacter maunaloa]